jgi:hypothetical protein
MGEDGVDRLLDEGQLQDVERDDEGAAAELLDLPGGVAGRVQLVGQLGEPVPVTKPILLSRFRLGRPMRNSF